MVGLLSINNTPSFTPAWRSIQTSGGGAIIDVHSYPDGTMIAAGDTFGPWIRTATGSITAPDNTTYTAPAWQPLITSTSLPSNRANFNTANSETTTAWAVAAAPSNTNVIYSFYGDGTSSVHCTLYYTTNRGVTWIDTGVSETFQPNGAFVPKDAMAVDPANQDVVYLVSNGSGVRTTSAGSTGGTWSLISTATIPAANLGFSESWGTDNGAGCVIFDSSQGTTGGKTNRILIGVNGHGMYESTDAGGTWTLRNAGSAPTLFHCMTVDSFGQIWSTDGFLGTGAPLVYKYSGGTWTTSTLPGISSRPNDGIITILQDPLYAGSQANNQVLAFSNDQGLAWGSINNGTSFTAQTAVPNTSASGQAAWLTNINYFDSGGPSTGNPFLNLTKVVADKQTAGKLWAGLGVDMVATPALFTGSTLASKTTWAFDTTGIDQMVAIQIIPVQNSKPLLGVWDRGIFCIDNPDTLTATQFPNVNYSGYSGLSWQQILMAWSLDFGYGTMTAAGVLSWAGKEIFAVSTDGGHTWSAGTLPTGMIEGSVVAVGTPPSVGNKHFVCIANQGNIQYSHDGATTWTNSTVNGTLSYPITSYNARRYPITADRTNADTFYFADQSSNPKIFVSTDGGVTFNATGGTINTTGFAGGVGADRLHSIPPLNGINTNGHLFYQPSNGKLVWSFDAGVTWTHNSGNLDSVIAFGIGGVKPGGSYPALYALQNDGGTSPSGYYVSNDAGATWSIINVPVSEQKFANHVMDLTSWLYGDWNVYGRLYVGYLGSTACYIDTADAVPYVNFSAATAKPNQNFTGTVTLTAEHSGATNVSSVQFSVDGTNIGSAITSAPYTVSWVTGGVATGAHTLKVAATNANGTASFSIPITTS